MLLSYIFVNSNHGGKVAKSWPTTKQYTHSKQNWPILKVI